jgi:hypothetical protein
VALRVRRLSPRTFLLAFKHRLSVLPVPLQSIPPSYNGPLIPQSTIEGAGQARRLRYCFARVWPLLSCCAECSTSMGSLERRYIGMWQRRRVRVRYLVLSPIPCSCHAQHLLSSLVRINVRSFYHRLSVSTWALTRTIPLGGRRCHSHASRVGTVSPWSQAHF